jgi:hypothetical protein
MFLQGTGVWDNVAEISEVLIKEEAPWFVCLSPLNLRLNAAVQRSSPDSSISVSDFPVSQTVRKLLSVHFQLPSLWYFVLTAQNKTKRICFCPCGQRDLNWK